MSIRDMYRKLNWQGGTPREVSEVVNNLVEGKSNNTGEITLNAGGATTTTIYDERIGYNSVVLLSLLLLQQQMQLILHYLMVHGKILLHIQQQVLLQHILLH